MAERLLDSLVVRLGFEVNNTTVNKIKNLLGNFSKQASKVVSSTEKISAGFQNISRSADRMPARLAQAGMSFEFLGRLNQRLQNIGKEVIGTSISWESAFAGVKKTVDATDSQLEQLSQKLRLWRGF